MKNALLLLLAAAALSACNSKTNNAEVPAKDTLKYPYRATYSSDITVPGNPANA